MGAAGLYPAAKHLTSPFVLIVEPVLYGDIQQP